MSNSRNSEQKPSESKILGCFKCEKVAKKADSIKKKGDTENLVNFISPGGCIYESFEFNGESTITIKSSFVPGVEYTSSFVRDGEYIRIKTDKSDLLLRIVDEKTLSGEGFALGTYKKISCR
jgi:hypothetical protein